MITKAQIISDCELQLLQASPSDETELDQRQLAFWASYHLNELVTTEINSKIARGEMIPSVYVKRAACEAGDTEDTDCEDDCQKRIYFELDDEVLTINKDMGIVRVVTSEGDQVLRASTETLDYIHLLRYAKPTVNNLVYSRQGKRIFIEGLKEVDIPFDKINVYYVPKQDLLALNDTDEVLVSDLVLPSLIDQVVSRGKLELYGTQADGTNDGIDEKTPVYHQEIARPQTEQ